MFESKERVALISCFQEIFCIIINDIYLDGFQIEVYDINNNLVGNVNIWQTCDKVFYLCDIFVEEKVRKNNIGTYLIELIDYLIKGYDCKIIYGSFEPFENNKKQYDKVNLERIVKSFYEKNHFSLMNFSDYYNNRDKYLFINETYFEDDRILIYRDYIPGNYSFIQISNFLVHENLINRLDEVDRFVKKKSMKLDLKGQ